MLTFLWHETLGGLLEEGHLLNHSLEGCNNQQCIKIGLWVLLDSLPVVKGLLDWNTLFSQVN
jgi:hypothetical protein